MKKALFALALIVTCLLLTVPVLGATETDSAAPSLTEYITDKIIPIVAGVATSLIALIGAIGKLRSSVSSLDSSSAVITKLKDEVGATLERMNGELNMGIRSIESTVADVPELKKSYEELRLAYSELKHQNQLLMEAIALGFSSIPDAVECGGARKIAIIAENGGDNK